MSELCTDTGCTDQCIGGSCRAEHEKTVCSVGRKHYLRGGVGCMSDYNPCERCGVPIYHEHMHYWDNTLPYPKDWYTYLPEDPDWVEAQPHVCHCCFTLTGGTYGQQ